jgi:Uma2 family endonuclease
MTAAKKLNLTSEADYLAFELTSEINHEYLGGVVYAMAGARNRHNRIAGRIYGALFGRLTAKPCQPCNSDTKIRIRMPGHTRYYYPDASVVCEPNPEGDSFEDWPVAVFEVLSQAIAGDPAHRRMGEEGCVSDDSLAGRLRAHRAVDADNRHPSADGSAVHPCGPPPCEWSCRNCLV